MNVSNVYIYIYIMHALFNGTKQLFNDPIELLAELALDGSMGRVSEFSDKAPTNEIPKG